MEQVSCFAEAVERLKKELFSPSANHFTILPMSAYETAWVAMVPDQDDPTQPMFPECLDWVLLSQNALGFWFDDHALEHHNNKNQRSGADLMATLTCLIALKTWEIDDFPQRINKGLKFLGENLEGELVKMRKNKEGGDEAGLLRWFLMVELAEAKGLKIFPANQQIKNRIFVEFKLNGTPLKREEYGIMKRIAFENGSSQLFRSPSVTACAFMINRDEAYKSYLQHMLTNCQHRVAPVYLEDEDIIRLCLVDHLERLGCAEHFIEDISNVLDHHYGKWIAKESKISTKDDATFQIYEDSLAFRLLKQHGYQVSPRRFCWFLDDEKMMSHMKDNYAFFLGLMLSIYKASHIAFPEDHELEKAGVFAYHILQMGISCMKSQNESNISATFEQEIEHELGLKWLARMDHLEHRLYIETGGFYHFWIGKKAPCRILRNDEVLQLAIDNFMMRQSVYMKEFNELQRWSKDTGLFMMGFGREKTTYCYFAIASAICLPLDTNSRKEAAKCAIFFTIADDFFDEKGSLSELTILFNALNSWEGEGLKSHGKVIFTALNNLVHDISLKIFMQHDHDVKKILKDAWREIFKSWLKEAEWSNSSQYPSIDEYLENAKTSVAVQMILLPECYLTNSKFSLEEKSWDFRNSRITKSLEISCRLLNDLESYEKEAKAGKSNIVLLYLKENPEAKIDDAIAFVRNILEKTKRELLQLVMSNDSTGSDMPREWKLNHLSCLKVFQMFYNSINAFDSPDVLLDNINKAIYEPLVKEKTIQPAEFTSKEFKTTKNKWSNAKVKISRVSKKNGFLSLDSNKLLNPWTNKKFNKPSIACFFMACTLPPTKVCFESTSFNSRS